MNDFFNENNNEQKERGPEEKINNDNEVTPNDVWENPFNSDTPTSNDVWNSPFADDKENRSSESDTWNNPYVTNESNASNNHPYNRQYDYNDGQGHPNTNYIPRDQFSGPYPSAPQKKPSSLKNLFAFLAVVTSISVIGLCFFMSYKEFSGSKSNVSSSSQSSSSNGTDPNFDPLTLKELTGDEDGLTAQQIYKNTVESTVGIVIYDPDIIGKESSQGTGVIVSSDGYIVTNSHVVNNSKNVNVVVVLNDQKEVQGKVVGYDVSTDLAVVKIEESGLKAVELGDSDQLGVGSWVLAIGNPAGLDFANSLTRGIVSAVNRSLGASNLVTYIQTDAAINPGNSGGPLIDMYGRVIGINSSKVAATGYEGMGFAIPSKIVKTVVDDIIRQGYVSRAHLGATYKDVTSSAAQMYGVPQGALITGILDGSDLSSQGVRIGDIITKVNGTSVSSTISLLNELATKSVGDEVTLTIYRTNSRSRLFSSSTSSFEVKVKLLQDNGETQIYSQSETTT